MLTLLLIALLFIALAAGAFELSVRNASILYAFSAFLCAAFGVFFLIGAFLK